MDEGEDEELELALLAGLGLLQGAAMLRQHAGPKVERVHVLPVVDGTERVVLVVDDAVAEVDGKLADGGECCRVAETLVKTPQLGGRVLHEVDALDRVGIGETAALDQPLIGGLEDGFPHALVANDHEPPNHQECCYPGGVCACRL